MSNIYAITEENLDKIIDDIIKIDDSYSKGGITTAQLLELIAITEDFRNTSTKSIQQLKSSNIENVPLFNPADYDLNIKSTRDGDYYDGNPPYSKEEQKNRMTYISKVLERDYNNSRYDRGLYTTYLYTSHYIENINFDRTASDEINFGYPVYAHIIVENDIDAFNQFYNVSNGVAIVDSFTSLAEGIHSFKNADSVVQASVGEIIGSMVAFIDEDIDEYLELLNKTGIVQTTDIAKTSVDLFKAYKSAIGNGITNPEDVIKDIYEQLDGGLSGMIVNQYVNCIDHITRSLVVAVGIISPILAGVCFYSNVLCDIVPMLSLAKLYYSYSIRKSDRFAVFVGLRPRP